VYLRSQASQTPTGGLSMKFFLDSANLEELKKAAEWGIVDGVTTNPSLIAKQGVPIEEQIRKICDIIDGDVSAEVVSTTSKEMIEEGRSLAKIHKNVVVKLPLIREGIRAAKALSGEGIRLNITLCFSAAQALVAAKAGAYIISPFIGRVDDIGWPGMDLIYDIVQIYSNFDYETQVLAASIRGPLQVIDAAKAGADIATMPFKVLDQLFNHPLTEKGLEQFLADHNKVFELAKTR
jgi:transaldolase